MTENIEKKRKKYIWLKLKQDFFHDPKIKKLRRIAGGDTYLCIYLKMMLWSLKNEGIIYFEEIEKTIEEELALTLDEDLTNIKVLLAFLGVQNLIEINELNSDIFMVEVPAVIGKEGDSAQRMRDKRERDRTEQKKLPSSQSDANVTAGDDAVTQRKRQTQEKELKETDTDKYDFQFSSEDKEEFLCYISQNAESKGAYKTSMRKKLQDDNPDAFAALKKFCENKYSDNRIQGDTREYFNSLIHKKIRTTEGIKEIFLIERINDNLIKIYFEIGSAQVSNQEFTSMAFHE